jgi:hypothetical protein
MLLLRPRVYPLVLVFYEDDPLFVSLLKFERHGTRMVIIMSFVAHHFQPNLIPMSLGFKAMYNKYGYK